MSTRTIYFAGGCFWALEKYFKSVPGVSSVVSGYANGHLQCAPSYEEVCTGETGFREAVKVDYDTEIMSLDGLLFAFFNVIDPTVSGQQGNDVGDQYQTGIYYTDPNDLPPIQRIVAVEKQRFGHIAVEVEPLKNFYEAEEYHQNYLDKNPTAYCHIPLSKFKDAEQMLVDAGYYKRPDDAEIKEKLSEEEYYITQESGTEKPFDNLYWDHDQEGLYVDVVTGEPLFSSKDKYPSSCGWPSFAKGVDPNTLRYQKDMSAGHERLEVRSRSGNSHLGHVFDNDPESPSGIRYCINSSAIRFIPSSELVQTGYGYLLNIFE